MIDDMEDTADQTIRCVKCLLPDLFLRQLLLMFFASSDLGSTEISKLNNYGQNMMNTLLLNCVFQNF